MPNWVLSAASSNLFSPHFLLFGWSKPVFFKMWLIWTTTTNLCPNMIKFDVVDFSECRSEEVMFLLMVSVLHKRRLVVCIRISTTEIKCRRKCFFLCKNHYEILTVRLFISCIMKSYYKHFCIKITIMFRLVWENKVGFIASDRGNEHNFTLLSEADPGFSNT